MAEKSKQTKKSDPFASLTWSDLESWAGSRIVSRGRSYHHAGSVKELGITDIGELVSWVDGSTRYATKVGFKEGQLTSSCTCPYGMGCKHAVAVVLEYLDCLKAKRSVPEVNDEDERLSLVKSGKVARPHEDDDEVDDEESKEADELIDEGETRTARKSDDLRKWLKGKSVDELAALISEIAERHPEIREELRYKARMATGSTSALVKTVSREIDRATSEPGWQHPWSQEGFTPDYSRVCSGLLRLLDAGHSDEVIKLGEKLFRQGMEQIGQSDDEGETACGLANALDVVFKALEVCSLPDVDKLEYAVNLQLKDEYELTSGLQDFWEKEFSKTDWSVLADRLLDRLEDMKEQGTDADSYHSNYSRNSLTDAILQALSTAGRDDEIIPLCIREADRTFSYERLVNQLHQAGRIEEAEEWIHKGISATEKKLPGIAAGLRKQLLKIKSTRHDWPFAAAIVADEFFERPSLSGYQDLKKASERAKVWPAVRDAAQLYLQNGKRPSPDDGAWPLPDTDLHKGERPQFPKPPFTDVQIDVAIYEGNIDETLRLYDASQKRQSHSVWGQSWGASVDDKVAEAVKDKFPDRAVGIWEKIAEGQMKQANPKAYSVAAQYLRKAQKVLTANGKEDEWKRYLGKLRAEHARKRRLIEILDSLAGKPIIA